MPATRFIISGKVQGVFFRASTREQARKLGLSGHAINLDDGCVEVVARGDAQAIAALAAWLLQGPPMARVDDVERSDCEEDGVSGFVIG